MDMSGAPIAYTTKDKMKEDIEKKCNELLLKYFEGRVFDKEKYNNYKNYLFDELIGFLNNYKNFGFVISFIALKGNLRINSYTILRKETDDSIYKSISDGQIFCEIRIFFFKLYISNINHLENIESNIILKMDDILTSKLEGKNYSYDFAYNEVTNIVNELNDFLLKRKCDVKPSSYNLCYLMKKPYDMVYEYKVLNANYLPLIASYSNNSLSAKLILFILNN